MDQPDPLAPVAFRAAAQFTAADQQGAARQFSGIAYGGGVVTDHPYFERVAFDLGSTTFATPAPALYQHRPDPVGLIRSATLGAGIHIAGELFSDVDEQAKAIAAKADKGMPWQLSVGIFPGRIDEVPKDARVDINGQTFEGPLTVFRDNRIREVSFCSLGADHTTTAQVFSIIGGDRVASIKEPASMSIDKAEHDRIVGELNATITAQGDELKALREKFEAHAKGVRLSAVKALFTDTGREFKDDEAAPYLAMADEAFDVLAKDLRAVSKTKLPANLASEQAKDGAGGGASGDLKTVEDFHGAAKKYIADQSAVGVTVDFAAAIAHLRRQQAAA